MLKLISFVFTILFVLSCSISSFAQQGSVSIGTGTATVTNYASGTAIGATPVTVVPADGTNMAWGIQAETSMVNLRCVQVIPGVSNPPSATNGWLITGGTTFNSYPFWDATKAVSCVATTSSASVSVWITHHN